MTFKNAIGVGFGFALGGTLFDFLVRVLVHALPVLR